MIPPATATSGVRRPDGVRGAERGAVLVGVGVGACHRKAGSSEPVVVETGVVPQAVSRWNRAVIHGGHRTW